MVSRKKLFERMSATSYGWGQGDVERLLLNEGFRRHEGTKHVVFRHDSLPRGQVVLVPRHRKVSPSTVDDAVAAVESVRAATTENE